MFGLIIIASVVIFGGLLAFLGDRVGMKVGKKRLSIFGLRPRYTSMIITVLTGFFIAGLTLFILTLISEYARTAIFELRNIQHELKATVGKATQLTKQVMQKEAEYKILSSKYDTLRRKLEDVVAQRKKMETHLRETQAQYEAAAKTLLYLEFNLKNTKEELSLAQNRLESLTKINEDLKNQISNLTMQETRLNQQIQNLEGWLKSLEDRNKTIVNKPMIFYVGEILVARVIDPGAKTDQVFAEVLEPILKEANEVALRRGARIPGKSDYALRVAPRRVAEVCSQLAEIKDKAVLRVLVEKNSVTDEPVTVTLEVYPNQMIFKEGEVVVDADVSAATSESGLRDQILSLLILANNKAIEKGIITDGQNLQNVISIYEIATIINSIKKGNDDKFKVSLVSVSDTYRVDLFKVKLELKPVKEESTSHS
jgi:uncharacterized protein (DUF3084 family)